MTQHELTLTILSPEKILFSDKVDAVTLPGTNGRFTILPRHAPIISSLEQGVIRYAIGGEVREIGIEGGFVELNNDLISVCVEQKINR